MQAHLPRLTHKIKILKRKCENSPGKMLRAQGPLAHNAVTQESTGLKLTTKSEYKCHGLLSPTHTDFASDLLTDVERH